MKFVRNVEFQRLKLKARCLTQAFVIKAERIKQVDKYIFFAGKSYVIAEIAVNDGIS